MDRSITARVVDLAAHIQQVPSPTFGESRRAEFIRTHFISMGIKEVFMDDMGNVFGPVKGRGSSRPLVVSAHLDTVFPEATDLSLTRTDERISGPGIGDNSLGVAGLSGLYWALKGKTTRLSLAGDLWLVANVGEEGLGNLKGMKAVVDRFGGDPQAYLVLEGLSLGQVYHRGLGVRRYRISVHTRGGHSWVDYGSPSAIHELAELVVKLKNIPFPDEPRTTLNVGVISGGFSVNTIAAEASLELDLRSESPQALAELSGKVEALVEATNLAGNGVTRVVADQIGDRPAGAIAEDHPLVKLAAESLSRNGVQVKLNIGSTDANEPLSRGIPAITIGLTTGGGAHTIKEFIDVRPVASGLQAMVDTVRGIYELGTDTDYARG